LTRQVDHGIDILVFDPGQDGRRAATEEAAAAGDLRGRQAAFDEPVDETISVAGRSDNQDELQGAESPAAARAPLGAVVLSSWARTAVMTSPMAMPRAKPIKNRTQSSFTRPETRQS
jgi:hypothetical protein